MLLPAHDTGLFTDLYELTMAASYLREGMSEPATFTSASNSGSFNDRLTSICAAQ